MPRGFRNAPEKPDPFAIAVVLTAIVMSAPVWCVWAPPMPDYPAHLASYHLIATDAGAPVVAKFYRIEWAFLPNLAGEIIVPFLSHLVGLDIAAKLFVTASIMMWVIGPSLVHRALYGQFGVAPLFAALFAYNANLTWGFLNYYFAMGAAFLILAAWIATDRRRSLFRLLGLAVAVTVIYFSHLFAAATLLLLLGLYELGGVARESSAKDGLGQFAQLATAFAPAALAYLFLKPRGGDASVAFNLLDRLIDRLEAALQLSYDNPSFVLLALLMILLVAGLWRGWIVIHRRMIAPLAVLALAALFAPEWAMGGWGVDLRLPAVLGALLFASVEFRLEHEAIGVLAAACGAVIVSNAAILAKDWRATGRQYDEFRAIARSFAPGTRLLTVLDGDAIGYGSDQPYWHIAEFAIIDPGAFTPLLFTTRDQHIVRIMPAYQSIAAASAEQGSPPDIDELNDLAASQIDEDEDIANVFPYLMRFQCHYNEAVVIHLGGPRSPIPPMLKLRHAGTFFSLYDILPDAMCGKK
jgi:hypothetical protein